MRPEQLALVLRPRSGLEAVDLGMRLVQAHARSIFASSFAVVLPPALLIIALVGYGLEMPTLAGMLIWWLKPLYDRALLHGLSHAVFGEQPGVRQTWRALPGLIRRSALLPALLWRRLDPLRSTRLPVDQLEGLKGRIARDRRRIVANRVGGAGFGLMFCCTNFEYVLLLGVIALIENLLPERVSILEHIWPAMTGNDVVDPQQVLCVELGFNLSYACVVALIEPFYVAGGFALYLKRRTDLEAWDVELLFRRLASEGAKRLTMLALAVACGTLMLPLPDAQAAEPQREAAIRKAPSVIADVLKAPEFGKHRKRQELQLRTEPDAPAKDAPGWFKRWLEFWRGAGRWMAEGLRVAGWIGIAIVAAILLRLLLRQLGVVRARRTPPPPPAEVAGLDIRPESLPDDVADAARQLLAAGRHREALGLLYRGALSRLAHQARIPFARGDTEGDCLMRVTRAGSGMRAYFALLTRTWQTVAYAHAELAEGEGNALCAGWREAFGGRQ